MFTQQEIFDKANDYIKEIEKNTGVETVLVKEAIIEKSYGYVFFYTSKKYYETGDDRYGVAGNAPFLIESKTGNIIVFGTSNTSKYYIQEYEAGRWPEKRRVGF